MSLLLLFSVPVGYFGLWLATPPEARSMQTAVVIRPVANLFSQPTLDADVVSQAIYSANITIVEAEAGWAKVRTADYTGWMETNAFVRSKPYATEGRVAQVESLFASLYRETDITRHQPILTVPFETHLEVVQGPVGDDDRWLQVRLPDDRSAWVQAGDVALSPRKLTISELIEFSKRFLGLPYLWGGVSTFGYDCSGLTQMLYRHLGYALPRDSGPQARWTGVEPVHRSELEPGDLLYFGASPDHITHTGMYLGEHQFISATAYLRPVVQISRLDDEHWSKLLVASRRLKKEVMP